MMFERLPLSDVVAYFVALPEILRETLSCWEMFRRFGFDAEQLFFGCSPDLTITMTLRIDGRNLPIRIGQHASSTQEKVIAQWLALAEILPQIPGQILEQEWERSVSRARACHTGLLLITHGVKIPRFDADDFGEEAFLGLLDAAKGTQS